MNASPLLARVVAALNSQKLEAVLLRPFYPVLEQTLKATQSSSRRRGS